MSRRSIIEEVYTILKKRILTCEYKPDQLIFEKEIVDELKVSRTPVREALNILNGEGLLHIIPNRGIQIASLSVRKMKQICEIRKILEPISISTAVKHAKDSDLENLNRLDEVLGKSIVDRSVEDIFKHGIDIHLYIAGISGNETLFNILKWLREESYRGYVYYLKQHLEHASDNEGKEVSQKIIDGHKKIVQAIKDRNEEEAIKYLIRDLDIIDQLIVNY